MTIVCVSASCLPPPLPTIRRHHAIPRYCGKDQPAPVQEAALRCLVSLTYVDRIVAPLAEAGCITTFVGSLASSSVPATVRHPAALALLNVCVHDRYKAQVAEAGGVEAAVALLGSNDSEVTYIFVLLSV